ncbi:MAG: hypothetical protein ACP5JG_07935 [Anaerolineae bacterium]
MSDKRDLLLLVADDASSEKTTAAATLAWLAKKVGADFETYITVAPTFHRHASMSTTASWHLEQFCFVANFYDVLYCAVSESQTLQFKREAEAFGEILSIVSPDRIADFYLTVFGRFDEPLPEEAVVIPTGQPARSEEEELERAPWIEPFCYPEIFHRRALGVSAKTSEEQWQKLMDAGVKRAHLVYCPQVEADRLEAFGLDVTVVDEMTEDDTYGALTKRVADRWVDQSEMMAFGDQYVALRSLGFYLRHRALVFYEPADWRAYIAGLDTYADAIGDRLVWGNQTVRPVTDNAITEFGKYDMSMSLGIAQVGMTVREKIKLPPDWVTEAKAPWEEELSDEFLEEQIERGGIPVCYLLYAADLGHLGVFARLFDILSSDFTRCGLGFPSTWYDFAAEALEQIYIPHEQGGVFPRLEPLLSSTGVGVGTEAAGYMTKATLMDQLRQALDSLEAHLGPRMRPLGYYPWQDACPYYEHQTAEPQWEVPVELGFDYCVTYKNEGEPPQVVYERGDFVAINQQNVHWWGDGPVAQTQSWEERLTTESRPGWIMIGLDSPFWCQPPFYYDPDFPTFAEEETSVVELTAAMRYANGGGESGKLFLAKPHEVVRFARMLRERGDL